MNSDVRKGRYRPDETELPAISSTTREWWDLPKTVRDLVHEGYKADCDWDWSMTRNFIVVRLFDERKMTQIVVGEVRYELQVKP